LKKGAKYLPKHPYFENITDIDPKLEIELQKFKSFGVGNNNLDKDLIFFWLNSKYFALNQKIVTISEFVLNIGKPTGMT
jgi:hypothetical protein